MHALEVIIARNAYAAGREAGHADNDDNDCHASDITMNAWLAPAAEWAPFTAGYIAGRKEG